VVNHLSDPEFGPAVTNSEQGNENEEQEKNANADPEGLVNEVSKQQIVIQYLKVRYTSTCSG
jgi:hypothetical protein